MVRQALDLVRVLPSGRKGLRPRSRLGHPVSSEDFQSCDDAGMQHLPPLLEEIPVGDLVGQSVLERVFMLGKEVGFVEKLGLLEAHQANIQ